MKQLAQGPLLLAVEGKFPLAFSLFPIFKTASGCDFGDATVEDRNIWVSDFWGHNFCGNFQK
jgi:hypothetical protein